MTRASGDPMTAPFRLLDPALSRSTRTSDVVRLGRAAPYPGRPVFAPAPVADLGHVLAVLLDVALVLAQLAAHRPLEIGGARAELRHALDHVQNEMEAIEIVQHHHVERRRGRPLLLEAADVQIVVI